MNVVDTYLVAPLLSENESIYSGMYPNCRPNRVAVSCKTHEEAISEGSSLTKKNGIRYGVFKLSTIISLAEVQIETL